jgi:hypothetical protein
MRAPDFEFSYHLVRRAANESVASHWRRNRDVLVWILYRAGASQRAIAYGHDLSRTQVRTILRRYYQFLDSAQRRPSRKILSPGRHTISDLRLPKKAAHPAQG